MAGTPDAVVGAALTVAEPARQAHHARRRAHGLRIAVDTPKHREEQRGNMEPQREVGQRRDKQAERHELADVAAVREKTVHAFADCIGEEQRRPDVSELLGREVARVDQRFLHHVQAQPADVVEAVDHHHHAHGVHAQPAVFRRLFRVCANHRTIRGRLEKRKELHAISLNCSSSPRRPPPCRKCPPRPHPRSSRELLHALL